MQLLHSHSPERHRADEHDVETDTSRPHVALETSIAFASDHFRRDVGGSSALLMHLVVLRGELARDSEVAYLDLSRAVKKNVV